MIEGGREGREGNFLEERDATTTGGAPLAYACKQGPASKSRNKNQIKGTNLLVEEERRRRRRRKGENVYTNFCDGGRIEESREKTSPLTR